MNHTAHITPTSTVNPYVNHKWEVNITPLERLGRIVIGLAGTIGGILLLTGTPTLLTGGLEVLLILAGLDMIVTGATGHCPLYKKLGHVPKSLRR